MTFINSTLSTLSKLSSSLKAHWNDRQELHQQFKILMNEKRELTTNSFLSCKSKVELYMQSELPKALTIIEDRIKQVAIINKYWWRLHVKFPFIYYSSEDYSDFLTPERNRKTNDETKLPIDESAEVLIFWVTEAYGPHEIDNLYAGLESLDWNSDRFHRKGYGCIDWIKRQRQFGTSGTQNVGVITRPGVNKFSVAHDYHAEFPPEVSHLIFKIDQICPSLTCINIGFFLNEIILKVYENELSIDRDFSVVSIKEKIGSRKFEEPFHIKQNAIELKRQQLRKLTTDWIAGHFPGIFCNGTSAAPTAELITTRDASLFDHANHGNGGDWTRIITQTYLRSSWQSHENEFIQLGVHDVDSLAVAENQQHLIVTFPTNRITEDDLKMCGKRSSHAYGLLADYQVSALLIRFAVVALINTFRSDLMRTRDLLKAASPDNKNALKALDGIQRFFSSSVQVSSIARELAEITKSNHLYNWECSEFSEVEHPVLEAGRKRDELLASNNPSPTSKLDELLTESTNVRSTRLLQDDIAIRDSFRQLSDVLLARANVKTQRTSIWLSFCAVLLAGMSVWLAIPEQNRQQLLIDAKLAKEEKKPKLDCVTISKWTQNLSVCTVENEKAHVENLPTAPSQKKQPSYESHPAKKH